MDAELAVQPTLRAADRAVGKTNRHSDSALGSLALWKTSRAA
jgi:hypothetical protein